MAVSFIILSCEIIVVYAVLLYFLDIFLLKYLFVKELKGSQFITSSYSFKYERFFSIGNFNLKNLFFDSSLFNN